MSESGQPEILPTYDTKKVGEAVNDLQISIKVNQEAFLSVLNTISIVSCVLSVGLGSFYTSSKGIILILLMFGNICLHRISKTDSIPVKSVSSIPLYTLFLACLLFIGEARDFFAGFFLAISCISGCLLSLSNLYISFKQKNE